MDEKRKLAILGIVTISISVLLSGLFFFEYFSAETYANYPFGTEGPTPHYYKSKETYLSYTLNLGFLFTGIAAVSILALLKRKRVIALASFFTMLMTIALIFVNGSTQDSLSAQFNRSRGYYGMPHDSTIGVPGFVFMFIWILIILFLLRLAWEFRDKIFIKNEESKTPIKNISKKKRD